MNDKIDDERGHWETIPSTPDPKCQWQVLVECEPQCQQHFAHHATKLHCNHTRGSRPKHVTDEGNCLSSNAKHAERTLTRDLAPSPMTTGQLGNESASRLRRVNILGIMGRRLPHWACHSSHYVWKAWDPLLLKSRAVRAKTRAAPQTNNDFLLALDAKGTPEIPGLWRNRDLWETAVSAERTTNWALPRSPPTQGCAVPLILTCGLETHPVRSPHSKPFFEALFPKPSFSENPPPFFRNPPPLFPKPPPFFRNPLPFSETPSLFPKPPPFFRNPFRSFFEASFEASFRSFFRPFEAPFETLSKPLRSPFEAPPSKSKPSKSKPSVPPLKPLLLPLNPSLHPCEAPLRSLPSKPKPPSKPLPSKPPPSKHLPFEAPFGFSEPCESPFDALSKPSRSPLGGIKGASKEFQGFRREPPVQSSPLHSPFVQTKVS